MYTPLECAAKARMEEITEAWRYEVYDKAPMEECWERTGKNPTPTKWVDGNMGDDVNPEYRSRSVWYR